MERILLAGTLIYGNGLQFRRLLFSLELFEVRAFGLTFSFCRHLQTKHLLHCDIPIKPRLKVLSIEI
jgi:hypothetical protein